MLDPIGLADHVKAHLSKGDAVAIVGLLGELNTVVGQDRVNAVWRGFQKVLREFPSRFAVGLVHRLRHRELAGSVNGDKEIELAFFRPDLGDIDVKEANGVALELLPFGRVPSMSGSREMPWRCRQRCKEARVRSGGKACEA